MDKKQNSVADCLFCKILKGEIPSQKIFENESVLGFVDIFPQAKIHLLFIHKNHTKDIGEMTRNSPEDVSEVFKAIHKYTQTSGLEENGYRIVTNTGKNSGQSVFHTHFHLLSGGPLGHFGE